MKLWHNGHTLAGQIEAFETEGDLVLDQKLVPYDVYGTLAHIAVLLDLDILTPSEYTLAKSGLLGVLTAYEQGEFELSIGDEDVHTKIEQFVTEKYGLVGKKIHTGRSRNDQVLTALRLYQKDKVLSIWHTLLALAFEFESFAKTYQYVPLPGYTHMQKAMPQTVGMWAAAFVESLLDDLTDFKTAYDLGNQSPLGSAAGFGIPLKVNRKLSSELLGFSKVQNNSLYCQNSRGKLEFTLVSSLTSIFLTLNKFASDVLFFTSSELGYFTVDSTLTTGSSIMPQKKNVDVAELIRSKAHLMLGNLTSIGSLSANLISGYNRDLQDSKKIVFESLAMAEGTLGASKLLLEGLTPNTQKLAAAMTPELFATHEALKKTLSGTSFRDAYRYTNKHLSSIKQPTLADLKTLFKESTHVGGTGNLGLSTLLQKIKLEQKEWASENQHFKTTLLKLLTENPFSSVTTKDNSPTHTNSKTPLSVLS